MIFCYRFLGQRGARNEALGEVADQGGRADNYGGQFKLQVPWEKDGVAAHRRPGRWQRRDPSSGACSTDGTRAFNSLACHWMGRCSSVGTSAGTLGWSARGPCGVLTFPPGWWQSASARPSLLRGEKARAGPASKLWPSTTLATAPCITKRVFLTRLGRARALGAEPLTIPIKEVPPWGHTENATHAE
jgi:hypothetical protein